MYGETIKSFWVTLKTYIGSCVAVFAASAMAAAPRVDENVLTMHLNMATLEPLGFRIAIPDRALPRDGSSNMSGYDDLAFGLDPSVFSSSHGTSSRGAIVGVGGPLFIVGEAQAPIDFRGFFLRQDGEDPNVWRIFDSQQSVALILDHAHVVWDGSHEQLSVSEANIRIGSSLAALLGASYLEGTVIGGAQFSVSLRKIEPRSTDSTDPSHSGECSAPWPSANNPAEIKLQPGQGRGGQSEEDLIAFERCLATNSEGYQATCSEKSPPGKVVFSPDASLINIGRSAIPWYGILSGRYAPYQNDQHPYLIWNLYRVDLDGTLRQIGRSGVKHAFYAANLNCGCASGHVLYPHCEDIYSSFSNDSLEFVGPRSEVIPLTGKWDSCRSSFDRDCDGHPGPGTPDDGLLWRLVVSEADLEESPEQPLKFMFEYGYFARDGQRLPSGLAVRIVRPKRTALATGQRVWQMKSGPLLDGPAISQWLSPDAAPTEGMTSPFDSPFGGGRVGVRVSHLRESRWSYVYGVMNFDLSRKGQRSANAVTGSVSHGLDGITLSGLNARHILSAELLGTAVKCGAWKKSSARKATSWTAGEDVELTWGSMCTVRIEATSGPHVGTISLHLGGPDSKSLDVPTLVPD